MPDNVTNPFIFPAVPDSFDEKQKAFFLLLQKELEEHFQAQQYFEGSVAIDGDLSLENGLLVMKETTLPTALADYGKVWTESDNTLHFQDGAGTEYTIDVTPV